MADRFEIKRRDHYQSLTTAPVRITAGPCEKVASNRGLGGSFRPGLRLPLPYTCFVSRLTRSIEEKATKDEISK